MPRYRHPRVPADHEGDPGFAVSLGGATVELDADGTFVTDDTAAVRALAAAYDTTPDALRVTETCEVVKSDGDVCGRDRPCRFHD